MIDKKNYVFLFSIVGLLLTTIIWSQSSKDNKVDDALFSEHSEKLSKGSVVLELFTSQGCSSCPPADALLETIKDSYPDNVFVLSYHVDYWNNIGWKDPFSNQKFTVKQSAYNTKFRYRSNYTPELVVNGKEHMVGSNRADVIRAVEKYSNLQSQNVIGISNITRDGDQATFEYNVNGKIEDKTIRAVLVLNERTTEVKRGENRHRTLKNANIVVAEKHLNDVKSKGFGSIEIPNIVGKNEAITLMLLVENEKVDITGAAKVAI
ncbi:DUF1223 domain-containing protein [Maribacter dokdonensis]|uniref:DUF1223 domain-containing protein n=1 Tax=Maribacter dokdonensis TaxID=320912 RepID=UPI002734633B|nr:DUF1223 domain-containing protein [Maribacter dokdonensis]MDP2527722.1 DUF1223 domain-containing protein [Maribacter dokdonensis]